MISARGGTPVRVTSEPASEAHPTWAARGDKLAYIATLIEHDSIWVASDLPDWTVPVEAKSWGQVKALYR